MLCSKCGTAPVTGRQRWCYPCRDASRRANALRAEFAGITEKRCKWCGETKPVSEFHRNKLTRDGYQGHCKACYKTEYTPARLARTRARYRAGGDQWKRHTLTGARKRAKRDGVPCTITIADIEIPETCPVLGIPLKINGRGMSPNSPTLDKVRPELGYVPGNVVVISWLANKVKGNLTDPVIFERVAAYLRSQPQALIR